MKLVVNNSKTVKRTDPCECGSGQKYADCCLKKDLVDIKPPLKTSDQSAPVVDDKLASSENFDEIAFGESINSMLKNLRPPTLGFENMAFNKEKDEAQDLVFEAMDMNSGKARRNKIEKALKLYPHLPDAWIMMGEEKAYSDEEMLEFCRKAVEAGEKDLGPTFFKNYVGHFWGMTESRPYMRAKFQLAQTLWNLGQADEAIKQCKDCLRFNPDDNQGVRYYLVNYFFVCGDLAGAESLLKRFKESTFAQFAYSRALLFYKKFGPDSKKSMESLKKAVKANSFVPHYLLGKIKMPKTIPWGYSLGSQEEAIVYSQEAARAWKESPGALGWLALNTLL